MVEVLPFLLLLPTLSTCRACWKSRWKILNGNCRRWQSRNDSVGALRTPGVLFVLLIFIQIEGWNCHFFPSVHLQTRWISTKMCLQRWISGSALGQRRNCRIQMVRPFYNGKEWEQVLKNAHRHLKKLFNDFKKYLG